MSDSACYRQLSWRQLTVRVADLYLFDGQMLFDRCTSQPFPDEWRVDETMTESRDTASRPQLARSSRAAATRAGDAYFQTPYSQAESSEASLLILGLPNE